MIHVRAAAGKNIKSVVDSKFKNISLAVLSGLLGFLAFPPFEFQFLAWICLVPLFFGIKNATFKDAFLYSFLAGTIFFGCILYWLVNITIPGMIVLVVVLSIFYGIFGIAIRYILKHSMDLFLLAFAWVIFEYVRSHLFTGFPWAFLGYTQYRNLKLLQIADFTGVYGISFLVVIFNVAVFSMLIRSKRKIAYMMVALLLMIMATAYGVYKLDNYHIGGSARLGVVQGNIPQQDKWDGRVAKEIIDEYSNLTKEAAIDNPDMIIWPETSYPYILEDYQTGAEEISALTQEVDIPMLIGITSSNGDSFYNSAVLFDNKGKLIDIYHKIHLVPFGEYIPFRKYLSFLRDHINKPIGDFQRGKEYTLFPMKVQSSSSGANGVRLRQVNFYKFGVLICFEDIFPYIARRFVLKGSDFLVNITNDSWFGKTAAGRQHLQASVLRAVENRVPVIRAANTGISCFVGPTGKVTQIVTSEGKEVFVKGVAIDEVTIYNRRSFYTLYGDVFVYFCLFMIVLLFITEGYLRKKQSGS